LRPAGILSGLRSVFVPCNAGIDGRITPGWSSTRKSRNGVEVKT
jgi:hypothetical protein